jgi:hypothetical protein
MTIDRARTVLSKFIQKDAHGNESLPRVVIQLTLNGYAYNVPKGMTAEETQAVGVWVREMIKAAGIKIT